MLYVGTFTTFRGSEFARETQVNHVGILGRSEGRARRYIATYRPVSLGGPHEYRSMVFVLPNNFRLSNDAIKAAMHAFGCDWQAGKFHCYRLAAENIMANTADWAHIIPQATQLELPNT